MGKGCVIGGLIGALLYALVFAVSAFITGSINGGGAVTLFVALSMFSTMAVMIWRAR